MVITSLFISWFLFSSNTMANQYRPEVYKVQKTLRQIGYNPGKLDGLWGKFTESAVKRFQRDIGLPMTGQLDEQTKAKLTKIEKDRHYIKYPNNIVNDTKTGLERLAGPDKNTTWDEAKQWVEKLTVAGGEWRMPTMDEIESLYHKGMGFGNMTPLLETTG